jgi:hypothetical protein
MGDRNYVGGSIYSVGGGSGPEGQNHEVIFLMIMMTTTINGLETRRITQFHKERVCKSCVLQSSGPSTLLSHKPLLFPFLLSRYKFYSLN